MKTTGLFFGSFNPIHNGHLAIAKYLLDQGYCTDIWFVVSPQNPWKRDISLLDEQKRFQIVEQALNGEASMEASDIEFTMPRPSYTYLTLLAFQKKYPTRCFSIIMGGDNLKNFHLWKNYSDIVNHFPVLVYPRPDESIPEIEHHNIVVIQAPMSNISSTEIRKKIAAGKDISAFVPASILPLVLKYYG